jgi:cadmium resistance protein CadD (predicted permease)
MTAIPQMMGTAAAAFAATNGDDFVVLLGLHALRRDHAQPRARQIVMGQYLGFIALVGLSAALASGLTNIPSRWLGVLGVVPLCVGLRGLWRHRTDGFLPPLDRPTKTSLASICLITVANGADNISVYTLLFRHPEVHAVLITVGVFALMLALWCIASALLVRIVGPLLPRGILAFIVPALLVVVGVVILSRTWLS